MSIKGRFMQAVQILAPDDEFVLYAAQCVREDALPNLPGGAALEFVAAMERIREKLGNWRKPNRRKSKNEDQQKKCIVIEFGAEDTVGKAVSLNYPITLPNAFRVKSAEYWLKLGEPVQAIMELEKLSNKAKRHPWALRAMDAAAGVLRDMNQTTIQE